MTVEGQSIAKLSPEWKRQRRTLTKHIARLERLRVDEAVMCGEALQLLALACDLLGQVTGRDREQVLATLQEARRVADRRAA